jgi:hypothetical protein
MTKQEKYLVKTVVGQLRYLRDEWNQQIGLDAVITNSNVLRMLLVDGNLEKCWRLCGYTYPMRLRVFTLSPIISKYGRDEILTAFTGGALHRGVRWALGVVIMGANQQEDHPLQSAPPREELTLDKYLNIPCMVIREVDISRVELIKYVANKLGGAHIDSSRKANKPLEQKFLSLDSLHNYQQVDKNIIPYELLSIGQELVSSKHVQRLMKRNAQ